MTASVLAAASDSTTDRVVLHLVWLAFMSWVIWNGVRVWRGEESRRVEQHERTVGPWPGGWGTNRKYRTYLGSAYLGVLFGVGFGLVSVADLVRLALGRDEEWAPWWAASYLGAALALVWLVLHLAYLWVGLPDRLRPPCQRGWEVVEGQRVLVRPGRTPQERAERRPLTVDPPDRARTRQAPRVEPPHAP